MTKTMKRVGTSGAVLLGAALAVALGSGGAVASTGDDRVASAAIPTTLSAGASDYWTSERMQAAVSADALVADSVDAVVAAAGGALEGVAAGAARTVSPQPAAAEAPVAHIGKVFFTLGGVDYVCSGNAVASANGSTVATAGHCLNEGPGDFATQWIFVPAYDEGDAPYGEWEATDLFTTTQWAEDGDINYDTGFAVVSGPSGATLSDTVGASGVSFNQSRGLLYSAFGYPAASPFDGESLQSCRSVSASDDSWGGTDSQGIDCDMTGGSSGGPWFIGSSSTGVQNSINSFGYDGLADTMFGPYWGSVIEGAYDAASSS